MAKNTTEPKKKIKVVKKKKDSGVRKNSTKTDNSVDATIPAKSEATEVFEEAETEVVKLDADVKQRIKDNGGPIAVDMPHIKNIDELPPLPTGLNDDIVKTLGVPLSEIKKEETTLEEQVQHIRLATLAQAVSIQRLQRKIERLYERNHMADDD